MAIIIGAVIGSLVTVLSIYIYVIKIFNQERRS